VPDIEASAIAGQTAPPIPLARRGYLHTRTAGNGGPISFSGPRANGMGSAISTDFEAVAPLFACGFWRVHGATHRESQSRVSLWQLDSKSARAAAASAAEFDRYAAAVSQSIVRVRRLHHPHVLRVLAMPDNAADISFAAEELDGTLATDRSLTADDITYVADQLLQTLEFLHRSAHLMALSLTPESIGLTKSLQVKLCDFTFATPDYQDFAYTPFRVSPLFPSLHFSAPEILLNEIVSPAADVFSWASVMVFCFARGPFFDAKTVEQQMTQVQERELPALPTDEMREMLRQALHIDAFCRPSLDELVHSKAFLQLSIRSLRFIDEILTKSPDDRYAFYEKMAPTLPLFSERILKTKFAPLFLRQVLADDRYAPALVPLLLNLAARFDAAYFASAVDALRALLQRVTPPQLALANLSVAPLLAERGNQAETLQPLFVAALQSDEAEVRAEALARLPAVVAGLGARAVLDSLVPALAALLLAADCAGCCAAVECLGLCLERVPADDFCERAIPGIGRAWERIAEPPLARAIQRLLTLLRPSPDPICRFVVPLAAGILASPVAERDVGLGMVAVIGTAMDAVIGQRRLEERAAVWVPLVDADEAAIQEPVRPVGASGANTEAPRAEAGAAAGAAAEEAGEEEKPRPGLFAGMSVGAAKARRARSK
jgi:hypothetical protein